MCTSPVLFVFDAVPNNNCKSNSPLPSVEPDLLLFDVFSKYKISKNFLEKSACDYVKTLDFFTNLRGEEGQESKHEFLERPLLGDV